MFIGLLDCISSSVGATRLFPTDSVAGDSRSAILFVRNVSSTMSLLLMLPPAARDTNLLCGYPGAHAARFTLSPRFAGSNPMPPDAAGCKFMLDKGYVAKSEKR